MNDLRKICKNCKHVQHAHTKGGMPRLECTITSAAKNINKHKKVLPLYFCHMFQLDEKKI